MKLTGIITKDDKTNRFVAYIHEFPGVVVEANSVSNAKLKLDKALENYFACSKKINDLITYA